MCFDPITIGIGMAVGGSIFKGIAAKDAADIAAVNQHGLCRNEDGRHHEGDVHRQHGGIGRNRTGNHTGKTHNDKRLINNRPRKLEEQSDTAPDNA